VVDGVLTVTGDDATNVVAIKLDRGATDSADDDVLVLTEYYRPAAAEPPAETNSGTDTGSDPATSEASSTQLTRRQRRRLARLERRAARQAAKALQSAKRLAATTEGPPVVPNPPIGPTVTEFNIAEHGITSILVDVGGGKDSVVICSCVNLPATIDAGAGNDIVAAGGGATTIHGGDGNDILKGGSQPDTIYGGAGDDRIDVTRGGVDTVDAGSDSGVDVAYGGDFVLMDYPGILIIDDKGTSTTDDDTPVDPDVVTGGESFGVRRDSEGNEIYAHCIPTDAATESAFGLRPVGQVPGAALHFRQR
jgi:Ca2+-binding RTX toxin-like protein